VLHQWYIVVLVIGHRGNTLRILWWYLHVGTPIIEVDTRFINDDFYAVHGPNPIRRASIFGKIMAWIDYHFFYRDPLVKPLKLSRILEMINGKADIMIDIKQLGIVDKLLSLLDVSGFKGKIYVTSELHPVIKEIKERRRDIVTIASINILPIDIVDIASKADADMVSIHLSLLNRRIIDQLHNAGFKVLTWTINDKNQAKQFIEMGVDGIVTDRPDIILKIIRDNVKAPNVAAT